jgi:hypothetical protein
MTELDEMKIAHCRQVRDTLAASIELLEHCIDDKQLIAGGAVAISFLADCCSQIPVRGDR